MSRAGSISTEGVAEVPPNAVISRGDVRTCVTAFARSPHLRESKLPVVLVLAVGLLLHAIDQAAFARAGPVPILLTAPAVATLVYLRVRSATRRRTVGLVGWGAVATGLGVLGAYLVAVRYQLPRALTGLEMVLYDLGMFLWFVVVLAVVYAVAARNPGRPAVLALLSAPALQAAFGFVLVLLAEMGVYAYAV
jgi:hypothetical protein